MSPWFHLDKYLTGKLISHKNISPNSVPLAFDYLQSVPIYFAGHSSLEKGQLYIFRVGSGQVISTSSFQ